MNSITIRNFEDDADDVLNEYVTCVNTVRAKTLRLASSQRAVVDSLRRTADALRQLADATRR